MEEWTMVDNDLRNVKKTRRHFYNAWRVISVMYRSVSFCHTSYYYAWYLYWMLKFAGYI